MKYIMIIGFSSRVILTYNVQSSWQSVKYSQITSKQEETFFKKIRSNTNWTLDALNSFFVL